MSKRVIRIPHKTGRRVRWTLEVSADADRKKPGRTTTAQKKAKRSRPKRRRSNVARPHGKAKMSTQPSTTTRETKAAANAPSPSTADSAPPAAAEAKAAAAQPTVTRTVTRWHAVAVAAVVLLVVAALALPRRSAVVNAPAADSKPDAHDSTAQPIEAVPAAPAPEVEPHAVPVAQPEAASPVVSESAKKLPAKPAQKLAATRPPIAVPVVDTRDKETSDARRADSAAATLAAPVAAPPVPETAAVDHVTITGCLEAFGNGDRFRLTDTEGANAPKARSWRTGFLKKRSAAVDLVGAADVSALHRQVGQRVAVSGVQTNRELQVSSVRVVSPSCN